MANDGPPIAFARIGAGDPAPWFHQRSASNPNFAFDTVGGRYIVLCFLVSSRDPRGLTALEAVKANRSVFDDDTYSFFGVTLDPRDEAEKRIADAPPGIRFFFDFDGKVARLYGAIPTEAKLGDGQVPVRPSWVILDPTMRVIANIPFAKDGNHDEVFARLRALPPPARYAGLELQAPVLFLPNVFEPELCQRLIALYEEKGGQESGFMRDVGGKTVEVSDHKHKRRRDYLIEDARLIAELQGRFNRRVVPEILKVHQFKVTRMERYLVACYLAEEEGHFNAHRDNTTAGTAHRRFACSVNLNADFEGGELSFPEYGPRSFKPPPGGAVVFSCSLLHAASKVTRGKRYAFLPFLYDEEAAKIREANNKFLGEGVGAYKKA